jgi:hypothetical protein
MSDYERGYEQGRQDAQSSDPAMSSFASKSGDAAMSFLSLGFCQPSEEYNEGYDDGFEDGDD